MNKKTKILLRGPVLTRSGYGEQCRFALRSLRSRSDLFEIFVHPLQWGATSWTNERDAERTWIDSAIEKTLAYMQGGGTFDMTVQVTIPNEWEKMSPRDIGYTAGIETTRTAHQWIQKGNEMDNIIVVSNHSKMVYEKTAYQGQNSRTGEMVELKLTTPVDVVNYPVKEFEKVEVDLDVSTSFNFLCVAQFSPRKNLNNTVKWFIEEFRDNEDVGLILKSNIAKNSLMDRERYYSQLRSYARQQGEHKCKFYLLHGDMTDAEVHNLYNHDKTDALIALAHGEGFGLPMFEAAYSGMPVVATGWSGQLDYLINKETGRNRFYSVDFDLQPVQDEVVWEGVIVKDSMWAYSREQSAKQQMRQCYYDLTSDSREETLKTHTEYAKEIREEFDSASMYKAFVDSVLGVDSSTVQGESQEVLEFD
tara:strand:+ start:294 stop:1553 length:1260 start_codon:yes stop_codon:yes gene_type:complete